MLHIINVFNKHINIKQYGKVNLLKITLLIVLSI